MARGYSFAMWVVLFAVVISAAIFLQVALRRTLVGKTIGLTEGFFWILPGNPGNYPRQSRGDERRTSSSRLSAKEEGSRFQAPHGGAFEREEVREEKTGSIIFKSDKESHEHSESRSID